MSKSKATKNAAELAVKERINFSTAKGRVAAPDFLDVQITSFKDFFQLDTLPESRVSEGLYKTFQENFPITDSRNQFVLEFLEDRKSTRLTSSHVKISYAVFCLKKKTSM